MANIFSQEDRILTTHSGSLPRPPALLDRVLAKSNDNFDARAEAAEITAAVETCVRRQAETGIDIVADGEEKTSFVLYVQDRLAGLEPRPGLEFDGFKQEFAQCLEDFEKYLQRVVRKGAAVAGVPIACAGPIEYVGQDQLQQDLDNLAAAAAKVNCSGAFMSSIAPSAVGANEYYPSEAVFLQAAGEALRAEYLAIVEAGFLLQIDDPFLPALFAGDPRPAEAAEGRARAYVDALNHSLRGIAPEKIRYHISCGDEAPRSRQVQFLAVAQHMLRVNAAAYSFEACNLRHEEDDELWETVRLPDGKVIMPGLIRHASARVEDPQQIADRLVRFADRVGRDSVVASVDNRGGPLGGNAPEAPPAVIWAKFEALRDGAQRASQRLWA